MGSIEGVITCKILYSVQSIDLTLSWAYCRKIFILYITKSLRWTDKISHVLRKSLCKFIYSL